MLDCSAREGVKCDPKSDETHKAICGSDMAFPYFISFYVLCSFLVSRTVLYYKDLKLQNLHNTCILITIRSYRTRYIM